MNKFGCGGEGANPFVIECLGVLAGTARPPKLCREPLRPPTSSHELLRSVARLAVLVFRFVEPPLPAEDMLDLLLELAGRSTSSSSSKTLSAAGMTEITSAMMRCRSAPHVPLADAPELGY